MEPVSMNRPRMLRLTMCAALSALFLFAPAVARADAADDAREANEELAEHGWVVDSLQVLGTDSPGVRHVVATGRIALPAAEVWGAMADSDDKGWPGLNNVVLEYENGDTLISRYELGIPVYADRTYRLKVVYDRPTYTMLFQQLHGYGNVKEIRGHWRVVALGDSLAKATYTLWTDPGVRWIPGFIITWATRREIPHLFGHLHDKALKRIEAHAKNLNTGESGSRNITAGGRR
jgi:hypothetical protein